jgi:SET domain-containing protein
MKGSKARPAPVIRAEHCYCALAVKPSRIHRWGIFALEDIARGRKLLEYTGKLVSRREGKRRAESNEIHCLFTVNSYWYIDGAEGGSGAEYMNHCCEPNCESRVVGKRVFYYALKPIPAGAELTLDYHFGKDQERVACSCGAPSCRRWINVLE